METHISRNSGEILQSREPASSADLLVKDIPDRPQELICGKLQYIKYENGATLYTEKAAGCIWVYLTDCQETIEAKMQHYCQPGNVLRVEGCHGFGCTC